MSVELKNKIVSHIKSFANNDLYNNSIELFNSLGYNTSRQNQFDSPTYSCFKESFIDTNTKDFNPLKAKTDNWKEVHLLFQLTQAEITNQGLLFDTKQVDRTIIETYLFFAIELTENDYSRSIYSDITREVNKMFPMPVMILFKNGNHLTLSVINRRLHKRDETKDVLEKITLIKDIDITNPHRGHIEILFDLTFQELYNNFQFDSFVSLHNAWQKTLDANELNKKFYQELANWYFWAVSEVEFPDDITFNSDTDKDRQIRNSTNTIRLITRLIFTWFLREKGLIPDTLFDEKRLKKILKADDKTDSIYYKAILQNLFFATLNTPMNADQEGSRKFVNGQHLVHTFYRYQRFFNNPDEALKLFENIPFLNGGLFECLDRKVNDNEIIRIDCFSENPKNEKRLVVPDKLFFAENEQIDLNDIYQTKNRKYKVRGLINILNSYKFTITENTPIEEEVALDPELLGKVFENLLASYNPETETTARKQTGSFYTPREIVNYMVDESLIAYFNRYLTEKTKAEHASFEAPLRELLSYTDIEHSFNQEQIKLLVEAIDNIKVLDPACGSGAFPMGILHKLVFVLSRLDEKNFYWRELQKQKAIKETEEAYNLGNKTDREDRLKEISDNFENNSDDFGRKLYLIENCIYGVDIQPIAVQIAKLRFFISLIVEQIVNPNIENFGIRPLPNLETKFVAANSLIGLEKEQANLFTNPEIDKKKAELKQVRHNHFKARTPKTKEKCRLRDMELRGELAKLLVDDHNLQPEAAKMVANWNPYDQNSFAPFFDTEWMFGLPKGFDVVIGNPPYIFTRDADFSSDFKKYIEKKYFSLLATRDKKSKSNQSGKINLFALFILRGLFECQVKGTLTFIVPNNLLRTTTYDLVRKYLLENSIIDELVDLGSGVFDNVTASTIIFRISNNKNNSNKTKIVTNITDIEKYEFTTSNIEQSQFLKNVSYTLNLFANETVNELLSKISQDKQLLGDLCIDIIEGIVAHKHLIIDIEQKGYLPLIEGKDIKRYFIGSPKNFLLWDKAQIHRTRPDYLWASDTKIIIQRISGGSRPLVAAIDTNKYKTFASVNNLLLKEKYKDKYYFILALLNSRVLNWYYANSFSNNSDLTVNISKTYLEKLPIIDFGTDNSQTLKKVIDYILFVKKDNDDFSFFERLIDTIIYEFYLPEILKSSKCEVLVHLQNLPELKSESSFDEKQEIVNKVFSELSNPDHPVSKAMHFMDTIEEIAIIEGKKS
jgi:adenine-specific DNA-methyltransferase